MLAHALNVTTTAEGVETEAQLEQVRRLGFNEMQGFLISRPVPGAKPMPVRRAFAAGI
jgi:EAL domain-containing protein (putative c-di-GMP-specific phosphodiesterase class I)